MSIYTFKRDPIYCFSSFDVLLGASISGFSILINSFYPLIVLLVLVHYIAALNSKTLVIDAESELIHTSFRYPFTFAFSLGFLKDVSMINSTGESENLNDVLKEPSGIDYTSTLIFKYEHYTLRNVTSSSSQMSSRHTAKV